MKNQTRAIVLAICLAAPLAACSDSETSVNSAAKSTGSSSKTTSSSPKTTGSALKTGNLQQTSDNPKVTAAVKEYHQYVNKQTSEMKTLTTTFTDAIRAGDVKAAQKAYAPSREPWERIEPIAGLIEELDGTMDFRVDEFKGVDDPKFTGWHRLEHILFEKNTTQGAKEFADKLDQDVATLHEKAKTLEIPAAAVPVGASELIEEVSKGKITGEEDRYSKTDLWDLNANVEGSKAAIDLLMPALKEKDEKLAQEIEKSFAELTATLAPLKDGDGWKLYCVENDQYPSKRCTGTTIDAKTRDQLKSQTAALSEKTAKVAGALGLK